MPTPFLIASDHAGVALKAQLVARFGATDLGAHTEASVDYPDFADALCEKIIAGVAERGILICGSGIGMSIAANRHKGIRAALCTSCEMAALARAHNDANVLVIGARLCSEEEVTAMLETFLHTPFEGGRHKRRVEKLG